MSMSEKGIIDTVKSALGLDSDDDDSEPSSG